MTSDKMPLILENHLGGPEMQMDLDDVDDLFGDAPLALPTRPPSKRLLQRLDELRSRGSCQGIAWGKCGTIASIAPDGKSLELRYIRADPKDATWGLSEPTPCKPWQNLIGGPIVHLSWSPTSTSSELAVIDAVGRVLILNFSTNLNRPVIVRRWDADPIDDIHAIVGTLWLNTFPTINAGRGMLNPLHHPAVKKENANDYNYETNVVFTPGPYHPNPNRSAFCCVTTNGLFKMLWNQNNGKIEETTLEMESITSADDLVTHAAICPDGRQKPFLYVALATASKQLHLVSISLDWGTPHQENKRVPPQGQLNPTLKEKHVVVSTWLSGENGDSPLDSSMTQLSHIELLPTALINKTWITPMIITVRSFVPTQHNPYHQETQSIIDRWEIIEQNHTLHPVLEQLGSRRNSTGTTPPAAQRLKRLDPVIVNKIIIGISSVRMGTALCFAYSDGTVEYRDRTTMNEMWTTVNLDRINSIHEAGFTQGGEPSCTQTAVSPTTFSIVQMCEDGKVKWHGLNYTLNNPSALDDAQYSAVVAALTMSTAQAVVSSSNIDDILAVARNFIGKDKFPADWVSAMVRMMRIAVDYSEDAQHVSDNLVRNNMLQMCLSTLNHLGWKGEYKVRSFRSKLSMFALNLRNIVILITIASNGSINVKDRTPLDEPEVVDALSGCCKWSIDLLCWLADSLFNLLEDSKFQTLLNDQNWSQMTPYLLAKNEIALHMVLSSSIRSLLSVVCRRMEHLNSISRRAISYYEKHNGLGGPANDPNAPPGAKASSQPLTLHHAYQKILRYTSTPLIQVTNFNDLLLALGGDIRKNYEQSLAGIAMRATQAEEARQKQNPNAPKQNAGEEAVKRAQTHCELTMLLGGSPPPAFASVVRKFFEDLRKFREHTNLSDLFFGDYDLLEVNDSPRALAARRQRGAHVDLFKRVEIFTSKALDGPPWRRCARCASVMEDVAMAVPKPGLHFLLSQQRNCCCGARIAVLKKDELVA